jgi:hypothetical protein
MTRRGEGIIANSEVFAGTIFGRGKYFKYKAGGRRQPRAGIVNNDCHLLSTQAINGLSCFATCRIAFSTANLADNNITLEPPALRCRI